MDTCSVFLCLSFLTACGVFGDEVKSVSVMEGDSVTLHTNVTKQRDDLIMWYYGSKKTFVARINGEASSTKLSDDERFKDRLELNYHTGALTITRITTNHSGLYTLKINRNKNNSFKKFNLAVSVQTMLNVTDVSLSWYKGSDINNSINKQTEDLTSDASPMIPESPLVWVWVIIAVGGALLICVIIIIVCIRRRRSHKASALEKKYAPVSDKGSSISSSSSEESNSSRFPNELEKKPIQLY